MRKITSFLCVILMIFNTFAINVLAKEDNLLLETPAYILIEASTGEIICEKNADERRAPASVTKIMTLLLIFDSIHQGKIHKEDIVTVSEHAASMGGSQVFLEPMETQNVDTMIKCIAVSSANDACVAMAEYISGSEEAFVNLMNERAAGLGMDNTHFVNSCGLDADGHETCARDIAIMSRELINNYPEVYDYSGIWMDTITHVTKKGSKEFGLSNTNKLLKQYVYATGLKTGSTSKAGCCLSATATKEGITLIAVVLGAPNSKTRFADAISLLNYGFGKVNLYCDSDKNTYGKLKISGGTKDSIDTELVENFYHIFTQNYNEENIERKIEYTKTNAPVKMGDVVGKCNYFYEGENIGSVDVIAKNGVNKMSFGHCLKKVLEKWYG